MVKKMKTNELMELLNNMDLIELLSLNNVIECEYSDGLNAVYDGVQEYAEYMQMVDFNIIDCLSALHFGHVESWTDLISCNGYGNLINVTRSQVVDNIIELITGCDLDINEWI